MARRTGSDLPRTTTGARASLVAWCTAVAALGGTALPATASAPPARTLTVEQRYSPANTFVTDDTVGQVALRFSTPPWARSAYVTVRDTSTLAIQYWADWAGTDAATLNCSVADSSWYDSPSRRAMSRQGRGALLIAPAGLAVTGVNTTAARTYQTCPYPYADVPSVGYVTVTFSSRPLTAHGH